ncbi:hypothetical protein [Paenibacillus sp. GCM10027626]
MISLLVMIVFGDMTYSGGYLFINKKKSPAIRLLMTELAWSTQKMF